MNFTFIFLLAFVGATSATFFGLSGGSSASTKLAAIPQQLQGQGRANSHPAPQVIKIILQTDNSHGGHGGHGGYDGHGSHGGHGGYGGHDDHAQIFKIIHQSAERSHGQNYASSYGHGSHWNVDSGSGHGSGGQNSNSKFLALLPQILQIVLADESGGHGSYANYGSGKGSHFFSTVSKGADFYKGGHVIEKGTLELKKIPNTSSGGKGGGNKSTLLSALPALLRQGNRGQSSGLSSKPSFNAGSGSSGWNSGSNGWSSGSSGWNAGW